MHTTVRVVTKSVYQTSDGREHPTLDAANLHERNVHIKRELQAGVSARAAQEVVDHAIFVLGVLMKHLQTEAANMFVDKLASEVVHRIKEEVEKNGTEG
jgi:hypothetical protein